MSVVMSMVVVEKTVLFANYVGLMILGAVVLNVGVGLGTAIAVVIIPNICKHNQMSEEF